MVNKPFERRSLLRVRARLLRPRWLPGPLGVLPMTMTR